MSGLVCTVTIGGTGERHDADRDGIRCRSVMGVAPLAALLMRRLRAIARSALRQSRLAIPSPGAISLR